MQLASGRNSSDIFSYLIHNISSGLSFAICLMFFSTVGCSTLQQKETNTGKRELRKIYDEIVNINTELRTLYETIGEFRSQTGNDLGSFFNETKTERTEFRKDISTIQGDLRTYKINQADLIQEIHNLSETLLQITTNIEEYSYRVSSVAQRLDSIDSRISQLSDIYKTISERENRKIEIPGLSEKQEKIFFTNLSNEILDMQTDLSLIKVKMLVLQEDLSSLATTLSDKKDGKKKVLSRFVVVPSYKKISVSNRDAIKDDSLDKPTSISPKSTSAKKEREQPPTLVTADPAAIYEVAQLDYLKGNYKLALSGFRSYINSFPDTELAPNAQYWIGECQYGEGQYQQAIDSFKTVLKLYPKSSKVPSAMLKIAYSLIKTNKREDAILQMDILIKSFPRSDEARLASDKVESLKKRLGKNRTSP